MAPRGTRAYEATTALVDVDRWFRLAAVAIVIGALLAHGGVTSQARAGLEGCGLLMAVALTLRVAGRRALPIEAFALSLPLWALVLFGGLQLVPLPGQLRFVLGAAPEASLRFPLVPELLPLSLQPASTAGAARTLATVGIVFAVALASLDAGSAAKVATWLVSAGGVVAAAGIWSWLEPGTIFPDLANVSADRVRGPFVNPDHFANWLAALLPLALAGLASGREEMADGRHRLRTASAAALPFLGAALALTFSRGGVLAGLCATAYFAAKSSNGRKLHATIGVLVTGLVLVAYVAWAGGSGLAARFLSLWEDPLGEKRIAIWAAAAQAIASTPLFGSGLGTFLEAARRFVDPSIPGSLVVDYAHNEPLQLVVEGGLAAAVLAAWGIARWARTLRRDHLASKAGPQARLSYAAEAGLVALLVGAMFDFALRLPAVALLAALLAALAIGANRQRVLRQPIRPRVAGIFTAVAALVGVVGPPFILSSQLASRQVAAATHGRDVPDWLPAADALTAAARLEPRAADLHHRLGLLLAQAGFRAWTQGVDLRGGVFRDDEERARATQSLYARSVNAHLDAISADRTNPVYRRDLGWLLTNLAALEEAFAVIPFSPEVLLDRLPSDTDLTDLILGLYEDAADLEPRDARLHYTLGQWALQRLVTGKAQGLGLGGPTPSPVEEIAKKAFRRGVQLDAALVSEVVAEILRREATYEDLRVLVPSDSRILWRLAAELEARGHTEWTDRLVRELLQGVRGRSVPAETDDLAVRLAERADPVQALRILRRLASHPATSPTATGALARVERRLGAYREAEENFGRAIAALPASPARDRLERDLGLTLIERGDLAGADRHFAQLVHNRPHDPWGYLGKGIVADREGRWSDATRLYQQARALAARDDDLLYHLGQQYFHRGLYHQAAVVWESGLQIDADSATLHLWLARTYARMHRRDAAKQHYQATLGLRPDDPDARTELHAMLGDGAG